MPANRPTRHAGDERPTGQLIGAGPANARTDQVATSAFWRIAWPHRMLTPINVWFEWTGEKGNKRPWFIQRRDGQMTLCATDGQVQHEEPQPGDGVAIITAASTGWMVDIHDQRPVALTPELAREWLAQATTRERARDMREHGDGPELFEWCSVDVTANNARNEGPQILTTETKKGLDRSSTHALCTPQILYT